MTRKYINVKASLATYLVFVVPIIMMMILFVAAYYRQGVSPAFVIIGLGVFAASISAVIWASQIRLSNGILSFLSIHKKVGFSIDEIGVGISFRSSSDPGYRIVSRVGYYLEVFKRSDGGRIVEKNIKMYKRQELIRLIYALRDEGVPVDVDQVASGLFNLGSSTTTKRDVLG